MILLAIKNTIILEELARGGFGSIYLAMQNRGLGQRLIVVKTIKKELSSKEEFRRDFVNEIRNAFPLVHPNIAQIYDYGKSAGLLYYTLEYIEGFNIRKLISILGAHKKKIPIPVAIFIAIQAAKGLHFAHTYTDQMTGKKSPIIHRDISPHNIMISYDGAVKVIDFGIAKGVGDPNQTQKGVFKGKPAYMPPEYILGRTFDHRFDQFSLGVVLWEMLTGVKLFTGKDKMEIVKKISKCEIPLPRFYNDEIDFELQEIVMKMLNGNYRKRYNNISIAQQALARHLIQKYPNLDESSFRDFVKKYFSSRQRWEEARMRRLMILAKKAVDDERQERKSERQNRLKKIA
jgi:serine/threonine protein kinase